VLGVLENAKWKLENGKVGITIAMSPGVSMNASTGGQLARSKGGNRMFDYYG